MSFSVTLLGLLGNGVLSILGVGVGYLVNYLKRRTKNETAQHLLTHSSELAMTVVKDVFQSYVKPLKQAGGFTPLHQAQAKASALKALKEYIGPKTFLDMAKALGSEAAVQKWMGTAVESAVHDLNRAEMAGEPPKGWRPDVRLPQPSST